MNTDERPKISTSGAHQPRRPPIGLGGQGLIFALDDAPDKVLKVFKRPADELSDRMRHLARFADGTTSGSGPSSVAWPVELILTQEGQIGAYVMRRFGMPEFHPLDDLFTYAARDEYFPQSDWRFLVGVARNLAVVVAQLHAHMAKFVIGDLSPANIRVKDEGYVTLLDSDSMQFTDPKSGKTFPCTVFTADFAPPELQDTDFPRSDFTDDFSLAVLILQLLLCGDHPFYGQPSDGSDAQLADNIRLARSQLIAPGLVGLPRGAVTADVLPQRIRDLAVEALSRGHLDPRRRPSARGWAKALAEMHGQLTPCPVGHYFHPSLPRCPWCARIAAGLPDPFGRENTPAVAVAAASTQPVHVPQTGPSVSGTPTPVFPVPEPPPIPPAPEAPSSPVPHERVPAAVAARLAIVAGVLLALFITVLILASH